MLNYDEIVNMLDEQLVEEAAGAKPALASTAEVPEVTVVGENTASAPNLDAYSRVVNPNPPTIVGAPKIPAAPTPAPAPSEPAVSVPESSRFAELLEQNEAYRRQQSASWEKRNREDKSRKTLAAVADALSSLGNLVGTRYGAFSQPQTYQMPFVNQDIEQQRALDRATADRIRATEQNIMMAEGRAGSKYDPIELEELKQRGRQSLQEQKTADALALEKARQEGRVTLKQMTLDYNGDRDKVLAELKRQGINISRARLDEAIRHNQAIEDLRRESGGGNGGGVSGYTTTSQTTYEYDQYGNRTGSKTVKQRTGANGQTTTTTTTRGSASGSSGGKKANPMGGTSAQSEGKKKKKNPMN